MKTTLGVGAMLMLAVTVPERALGAELDAEVRQLTMRVCASCHGPTGASISPLYPNLAGQQAAYIEAQLHGFRDRTRGDPSAMAMMWGMSSQLSDDMIKRLGAYYAALSPAPGTPGDKQIIAKGRQLYDQGGSTGGSPACGACHGPNAEGSEGIPRLAGQHPAYVVKQLAYFKSRQRGNAPAMHAVADTLTLEDMEAVAAYVASR